MIEATNSIVSSGFVAFKNIVFSTPRLARLRPERLQNQAYHYLIQFPSYSELLSGRGRGIHLIAEGKEKITHPVNKLLEKIYYYHSKSYFPAIKKKQ